jgi:two-component system chemotaxis response regulator CheB
LPTSTKVRVLIVDDAVVVRKALSDALVRDPAIEVVGAASNGKLGLAKFTQLRPDLVLLDIEKPEMNGLETVLEIRKLDHRVPIVMFSKLTERGAEAPLEALPRGATDYVAKPSNSDMEATSHTVFEELNPKVKALCHVVAAIPAPARVKAPLLTPRAPLQTRKVPMLAPRVQVVAIGVSTGGPEALAKVLPALPANFSCSRGDRATYAAHLHLTASFQIVNEKLLACPRMPLRRTSGTRLGLDCARRLSHGLE